MLKSYVRIKLFLGCIEYHRQTQYGTTVALSYYHTHYESGFWKATFWDWGNGTAKNYGVKRFRAELEQLLAGLVPRAKEVT